jgi:hypothetical protein
MWVVLLWSSFEDIKCGFVDEICVNEDFVSIMLEHVLSQRNG